MSLENLKAEADELRVRKIPQKIIEIQALISGMKAAVVVQPMGWKDDDLKKLNDCFDETLLKMVGFYYPLNLWISFLEPPMEAVESFQLHVQKTAISMLESCDQYIKAKVNNTAEFYVAYGRAIKHVAKNPVNSGYTDALKYIRFQRVLAVMSALEDLLHNLLMIDDFFKKNLSIIEGNKEKHLFH